MKIFTAEHVLPISGAPLSPGAVVVDGALIKDVGHKEAIIRQYEGSVVEDHGKAAIVPA